MPSRPGNSPGAIAHRHIGIAALEIGHRHGGVQQQVDLGMDLAEALETGDQPGGGEGGHDADRQAPPAPEAADLAQPLGDAAEALAEIPQTRPAGLRQLPFAIDPAQELGVQIGLQQLHLLADRRGGHMQLGRGPLEALMPGGGLEGAQGVEGGKAFRHGRST